MDKESNHSTVSSPTHTNPLSDLSKDQLLQLIGEALITTKKNSDNNNNNNNNHNKNNNNNNTYNDDNVYNTNSIENNSLLSREIVSPQSKNDSISLNNNNNVEHFLLPLDEILRKLNKIQNESLLLGNKDLKLKNWFTSLKSLLESCIIELNQDKEKMNIDFKNSLDTITKIFLITSRFSNNDLDNEFNLSLNSTSTIQALINDYNNDDFISLENYCNENNSMFTLNKDIEDNILKLIPILSKNLINYKEKLSKFYSLMDTIDNYKISDNLLNNIPTRDEILKFKKFDKIQNIKSILNSNFNRISPVLQNQIDNEISKLNSFINERFQKLFNIQSEIRSLFDILYEKNEVDDFNNSKTNFKLLDLSNKKKFIEKFNLKTSILTEFEEKLLFLKKLKSEREDILNNYLSKVKNLWSILRPNSNEIQNFLKLNNNLFLKSLNNFEKLLKELELEKMENIAKFIESIRTKISGYWDLLMYDEETRKSFKEFFINNVSLFDESLLNLHSIELEKLRIESHNLKPLLKSIGFLNELLNEKTQLENSTKDPNRLLKRNSFKILRQEEKIRDKLKKLLPVTISELKEKIINHESQTGRIFKINKIPYLLSLEEIENSFTHKRIKRSFPISPSPSKSLSASNSIKKQKLNRSPLRSTNKHPIRSRISTPANSVIRKRYPNELSNPFLSRDPTPLKTQKSNALVPLEQSNLQSNSINSINSLKFANTSISKSPIVIKGGSPMRSLNLAGSKVILTNDSRPVIKLSSPFSAKKTEKFKYPILSDTKLPLLFNSNILENNNDKDNTIINKNGKRVASNQLNPNLVPVEELSDSMIEYSEIENKEQEFDKENIKPIDDTYKIEKFLNDDGLQNTTWDMETF